MADMAAILDACGVPRAVIGGLSLGGYLSLAFRLAHPERVAALVLFDTGPGYKSDDGTRKMEHLGRVHGGRPSKGAAGSALRQP